MNTINDIIGYPKVDIERVTSDIAAFYLSYPIKKSSGKLRWIDAPQEPLKTMQRNILFNLIYKFQAHPAATGFIIGKGVKDGAQAHLGHKTLLCLDLSNFFNSIKYNMAYRVVHFMLAKYKQDNSSFNFTTSDVETVTNLLTYKNGLPQGSPASPGIANIFCIDLDKSLAKYANDKGMKYTRYADDLAFSHADVNYYIGGHVENIEAMIKRYGLKPNRQKTRILRPHKRMCVTGIVINEKLGTPKYVWRNLKAQIHNLVRDKKQITQEEYQKLRGKVEWVRTLHPKRGNTLLANLGQIILSQ